MLDDKDGFTKIVDLSAAIQNKRGTDGREMPTAIESILILHIKMLSARLDTVEARIDSPCSPETFPHIAEALSKQDREYFADDPKEDGNAALVRVEPMFDGSYREVDRSERDREMFFFVTRQDFEKNNAPQA